MRATNRVREHRGLQRHGVIRVGIPISTRSNAHRKSRIAQFMSSYSVPLRVPPYEGRDVRQQFAIEKIARRNAGTRKHASKVRLQPAPHCFVRIIYTINITALLRINTGHDARHSCTSIRSCNSCPNLHTRDLIACDKSGR